MRFIYCFIILTMQGLIPAEAADFDLNRSIKYFDSKCTQDVQSNTLILIDNTAQLKDSQKQFVQDNFISSFNWENEGDRVTVVSLHDSPVALMPVYSLCAPKPAHKIDEIYDPIAKIRAENKLFLRALQVIFEKQTTSVRKAKSTLLMEAITEVYRSTRYHFNSGGTRQLILVSDLYQHSNLLSFLKQCRKKRFSRDKSLTCPSISDITKVNSRFSRYLEVAKPELTPLDRIKIFYLNTNGRVDRSAEDWWSEYFFRSGVKDKAKLDFIPELQN